MSRTIKFRAWSVKGKRMYTAGFQVSPFNGVALSLRGEGTAEGWYRNDDLLLMQFTGLTDRHGKEVYEGDVVRKTSCGDYGKVGVVVYEKAGFQIGEGWDGLSLDAEIEVLGNLYEHPELVREASGR